jgi:diguanylate cyclase (GGDEF)-like protein
MRSPRTDRPIFGWAAVLTSSALTGLAVALVAMAQGERSTSNERAEAVAEGQLLEARRTMELATLEVIAVRMLDAVGLEGDRSDRLASAASDVRTATSAITRLADGDGRVAEKAKTLLGDAEMDALTDPAVGDLDDLFEVAGTVARYGGASEIVTTQREAIQQLSFVSTLPLNVLIEGIAADASVNDRTVDPSAAAFVDTLIDVARTEGGWFGTDPSKPLDGSIWIEIDEARDMLPEATERLGDMVASSRLVIYDAWMRELRDGMDMPPLEPTEALAAVDEVQPQLVSVIDELFADDAATRAQSLADQKAQRDTLLAAAAAVGVMALFTFLLGVLSISRTTRASHQRAELAMRDGLTGVGNRHELDVTTRVLTMDPRLEHHVVAMLDLDRFKMVNDIHGHAAGDAILVEVATRLQQIATRVEDDSAGVVTSVIRLGGDEFLFTAHSPDAVDADLICAELDEVRGDSIVFEGEHIDLGFSVGIVVVNGQHELSELMSAADLAVFDDKAARARERTASGDDLVPTS